MTTETTTVFVYGTLKRGHSNHQLLDRAEFLGEAVTKPEFTMLDLGFFPGVIKHGRTPIYGEIYRVDQRQFQALDRLEGYPDFYGREQIDIPGRNETPWMYILPVKYMGQNTEVDGGIWE